MRALERDGGAPDKCLLCRERKTQRLYGALGVEQGRVRLATDAIDEAAQLDLERVGALQADRSWRSLALGDREGDLGRTAAVEDLQQVEAGALEQSAEADRERCAGRHHAARQDRGMTAVAVVEQG